jgi:hypothetical protein
VHGPRILIEDRTHRCLIGGRHGQQRDVIAIIAADRSADDDDAALHELVGEGSVLFPERLLPRPVRPVPVDALSRRDREHRHDFP